MTRRVVIAATILLVTAAAGICLAALVLTQLTDPRED